MEALAAREEWERVAPTMAARSQVHYGWLLRAPAALVGSQLAN